MGDMVFTLATNNMVQAEKDAKNYAESRVNYFLRHLKPLEWSKFLGQAFAHYVLLSNGKFSIMSEEFNALPYTILSPILIIGQIIFLMFFNKWYAGGNILLLILQAFTLV